MIFFPGHAREMFEAINPFRDISRKPEQQKPQNLSTEGAEIFHDLHVLKA